MQVLYSNEDEQRKAAKEHAYTSPHVREGKESIQGLVDSGNKMNIIIVDLPQVMHVN